MEYSLQLKNINCQKNNHNESAMVAFCIDENCHEQNKFACLECLFDTHQMHKIIKFKDLNDIIEDRYKNYKNKVEEEKEFMEIYKKNEEYQLNKLKKFKNEIIKVLEVKIMNFMNDLKQLYPNIIKSINNDDKFSNIKEFVNFFGSNAAPTTKPELTKLSEICMKLYKEGSTKEEILEKKNENEKKEKKETDRGDNNNLSSEIENKIKANPCLNKFNKKLDELIKDQLSLMTKYIEENILVFSNNCLSTPYIFEWCSKSYTGDGFLFELSNNNKIGTKIMKDETMTILRSKEEIKNNLIYNIKFKIGLKKEGDFDIGIGTEKEANTCWLRNSETISISNKAIRRLGMVMDDRIKLKDNDILDIEISTKEKEKYFKAILNNNLICDLDFELDNIFFMAAIRNVGNYIEVLDSKISDFFV